MTDHELLGYYLQHCRKTLEHHARAQRFLEQNGVRHQFVADTFYLGFADGSVAELCRENEPQRNELERSGLLKNGKERFKGCLIIPILDENKEPVSIVGYSIHAQRKEPMN